MDPSSPSRSPSRRLPWWAWLAVAAAIVVALAAVWPGRVAESNSTQPTTTPPPTTNTQPSTTTTDEAPAAVISSGRRLLGSSDLVHKGSFTVPDDATGSEDSLAYGGMGLAFNPANNSLFITGHDWHQLTAEITIPELVVSSDPSVLTRATFVQRPQDAADGNLPNISTPADPEYARVGGYLVDGDTLILSAFDYYDASGEQTRSHLLTDISLGTSSPLQSISPEVSARWLGGPMALIPESWQPAFGGDPYIGGLGGVAIASNSSVGPSASTFSLESFTGEQPATLVLGYPLAQPLDVPEQQSDLWNLTSTMTGIVFPERTASVLFFGTQGLGEYCYGTGEECGDPLRDSKGTHAYPYRYQVWAYDAAELAAVADGQRAPESLRPYDHWELELPIAASSFQLTGAAYDPSTNQIFIAQEFAEGTNPVIHAFGVGG